MGNSFRTLTRAPGPTTTPHRVDTPVLPPHLASERARITRQPESAPLSGVTQPLVASRTTSCAASPRACPFGGACHTCPAHVQTQRRISRPGDEFEREADRAADSVMRSPTQILQRKGCTKCGDQDDDESPLVQRQVAAPRVSTALPIPPARIVTGSGGAGLPSSVRTFFEPRFGHDFSRVRVHTDTTAAASARAVNALAYTVGPHIVFGAGQYAPHTEAGRRLVAHELTHVVQQSASPAARLTDLAIGETDDPAEREADRVADVVTSGGSESLPERPAIRATGPALRRTPTTPQTIGETRKVILPQPPRGQDQVRVHVIRSFDPCPCRKVPDTRTGVFYNPELNNLAIAYRHCRGGRTVDVYGQLESNASAFLTGSAPPTGTARIGIDINVVGRNVGGRVVVEAIGTNEDSSDSVGGRAKVVFQGSRWRVFLEPQFIRRLGTLPSGTTPNDLEVSLGAQFGGVTLRADFNDLLDPAARSGKATLCIPAGSFGDICPFIEASEQRGVTGGVGLNIPFGGPEVRQEECYQCFCPPPVRKYRCIEDVLPRDEEITEDVPVQRQQDLRYYFRLDRSTPEPTLVSQSNANLSTVAGQLRGGGQVRFIIGYTSPEATETHNNALALERARTLHRLVQQAAPSGVTLPEPSPGGELLGRRPNVSPGSRLGDVITESGFRSAEDLTILLSGDEIPNAELADQFLSLFNALPEPGDRLAIFGLTADSPIAPEVLASVDQFVRGGGRGPRPWERIFRLLRVGVVGTTRTELEQVTRTEHHSGSVQELSDADCRRFSREAEATGEFGPVDPAALKPSTSSEDRDVDCTIPPQAEDTRKGCDYTLPSSLRRSATAPGIAPRAIP